jgi:predicted anti-sigma-YlaC factor YlaD
MAQHDKSAAVACTNWEEDLVLYYYGELDGSERATIEGHVQRCEACRSYLKEMESILPLTVEPDEPPQAFWDNYSREMRGKLTEVTARKSWWQSLASFLQPWAIPVSATAIVAILALTLTLGKGFWSSKEVPQDDEAFLEILPAAENLEFFKTMEVLDAMDFLEDMGNQAKGSA